MSGLSESDNRVVAALQQQVSELAARNPPTSTPSIPKQNNFRLTIYQANTFVRGKAVYLTGGSWALINYAFTDPSQVWGIVERANATSFTIITAGEAVASLSAALVPGGFYWFQNGDPVILYQSQYPPPRANTYQSSVQALTTRTVFVESAAFKGLQDHDGCYTLVGDTFHEGMSVGHFVNYVAHASATSMLALADEANPYRWTYVGVALFEVTPGGSPYPVWLVLIDGTHGWSEFGIADPRPAWAVSVPWNAATGRTYLSDINPGQPALTEPAFKVFAGHSYQNWLPASGPDPSQYTMGAFATGQGVVYPIPASGGGTGIDLSTIIDHATIVKETVSGHAQLKGYTNLGTASFWTQGGAAAPTWTVPDSGTFQVTGGGVFKLKNGTTLGQFLRWNGSAWVIYGPLLSAKGHLLSHDGTDLVDVDASTPYSVLGVASTPLAVPAPIAAADHSVLAREGNVQFVAASLDHSILVRENTVQFLQASADGQLLVRSGGALTWLTAPTADGYVLRRLSAGVLGWGVAGSGLPAVTAADEGQILFVNSSGVWANARDIYLGKGGLTASSTQGSFGVVKSSDGDYIKLSSGGIEIFDRSVSTSTALITINIGHASLNATERALTVREIDVCSGGVAMKMLVIASAPY